MGNFVYFGCVLRAGFNIKICGNSHKIGFKSRTKFVGTLTKLDLKVELSLWELSQSWILK
ncbi:hypothetical protein LEP1GSC172_1735 [Leptospira noguchii]|uniref:Uncharacterized protein n=1 Tax=Leptospira noguchii TaxID=28182 RepID=M6V9C0_9LEPT|nr:hypothetical protein LEP1GSC172_1735 [Leptospira noguchii]